MEDFLNQELRVGDRILAVAPHGRNSGGSFVRGVITKLTEKTVFYQGRNYSGSDDRVHRTISKKVIKI